MTLVIRTMSRAEVELMLDWAAAEGWNPGLGDATPFHVSDPNGFLVGLLDDEPAAAISVVRYGDAFGFLGLYITAPHHRGQGYGLQLWQAGLAHLGQRIVGLDGVVAQQANYRRSGFAYAWPNFRFGGLVEGRVDPRLVGCAHHPLRRRSNNLDRLLFPAPRPAFLAAWLAMPESRTLALVEGDTVTALGTRPALPLRPQGRPALRHATLSEPSACCAASRQALRARSCISMYPVQMQAAMRLAQELGLTQCFETARMYKGPAPRCRSSASSASPPSSSAEPHCASWRRLACSPAIANEGHRALPELPDIEAYLQALRPRILGHELVRIRRGRPFILRTVEPPIGIGRWPRRSPSLRRIGKRIAIGVSGDLWLVLHLMIAGRLHWRVPDAKLAGRNALLALDFAHGSLVLTEAGSKRRASLHLVRGRGWPRPARSRWGRAAGRRS